MIYRNMLLVAVLCSIVLNSIAQVTTLRFNVMNKETGEIVPFANLGLKGKNIGTNADEFGRIVLRVDQRQLSEKDFWVFSSIGYERLMISHDEILGKNEDTIYLMQQTQKLKEIYLTSSRLKEKSIGRTSHGSLTHINIYSVRDSIDDGLSQEFGVILNLRKNCLIDGLNVYLSSNNFDSLRLEFGVYTVANDCLSEYPMDRRIYFTALGNGWQKAELAGSAIALEPGKYAFTARIVKRIFSGDKPRLSIPVATPSPFNAFLYRAKSQDRWNIRKSLNPSIYIDGLCE